MAAPKTVITFDLDGSNKDFEIPFEYLARKFIVVTLIGTARLPLTLTTDYRFSQRTVITTVQAWGPAQGYNRIEIRRVTSATERLVDFSDGSVLRAYDLNTSNVQSLHIAEEGRDIATDTIGVDNDGNLDARGRKIVNLADGENDGDAVSMRQVRGWDTSALASAIRAEAAAVASEVSQITSTAAAGRAVTAADRASAAASAAETWGIHSIRTPLTEEPLRELPHAALRANSVIGFDEDGNVVLAGPTSGSAADLAIQLANPDGVQLVGNALDKRTLSDPNVVMQFAGMPSVVDNVATARTLNLRLGSRMVITRGYYTPGDGGHATYLVNPDGTKPDDGGNFLVADAGGNLELLHGGRADLRKWGCKGDDVTDDTARLLAAVNSGFPIWVPRGRYRVSPIGPDKINPGGREIDRSTAAWLSTAQGVSGEGSESSVFVWNNTRKQAFFGVKSARAVRIKDVGFEGGYTTLLVDAEADDSVQNCGLVNVKANGQLISFIAGLQITLNPQGSKRSRGLYALDCEFTNVAVAHAVMTSNVHVFRVIGCTFNGVPGGYCIDMSHGSKFGVVANNVASNSKYFAKTESSTVAVVEGLPMDPEACACRDIAIIGNVGRAINDTAILLNSLTERVVIDGNDFEGMSNIGIVTGAVTGNPADAHLIISNNIIRMYGTNAIGLHLKLNQSGRAVMIFGNTIEAAFCIRGNQSRWWVHDNTLKASSQCFVVDQPSNRIIADMSILANRFEGPTGINLQVSTLPYRNVNIKGNSFDCDTPVYAAEVPGIQFLIVMGNTIHSKNRSTLPGMSFKDVSYGIITENTFNQAGTVSTQLYSIRLFGTTVGSIIKHNITTRPIEVQGRDADTTANFNTNIVTAQFADSSV